MIHHSPSSFGQSTQSTEASIQSVPNTPAHGTPSFMDAFTPPVPPLPQDEYYSRTTSPIADVFTSHKGTSDTTKPLPPIQPSIANAASEESLVLVEQQSPLQIKSRLPESPVQERHLRPEQPQKISNHIKRRSMSVGEIEIKKAMTESSLATPLPATSKTTENGERKGWDTTLNGILSEFEGELSQLDPISSSLELRDPSTPARRALLGRSKTDGLVFPYTAHEDHRTPTLTLQPAPIADEAAARSSSSSSAPRSSTSTEAPIVPPRTSSLTPTRSPSGSSQASSSRAALRHGPSPLRSRNGYPQAGHNHSSSRDSMRLRMQHRSSASSSEPSLIPIGDDTRIRVYLSVTSSSRRLTPHSGSPAHAASSQQDLTTNELALSRYASRNDDSGDLEVRGKDLASRCFAEDEEFLAKEKIAEWLGGQ